MARGDNLTRQDRARGGHHSHSGGNRSMGHKGGSSRRGLASADRETRERVARAGGEA